MNFHGELLALMSLTAAACALPGAFLLLRRMALLADAISHVVLLGIVLAFFLTHDLHSPLLTLGATLTGVALVAVVELLQRARHVRADAALGLVFPTLFSIAVILVSQFTRDLHLDADSVLLGMPELAPLNRLTIAGRDFGPKSCWFVGGTLLVGLVFVAVLYKELKLSTFDPALAAALGFAPGVLNYALTTQVALTAVTAFDAVGSALVVALMIVPAATALLLTERLSHLLMLSVLIGIAGAVGGTELALKFDLNIPGSVTTVLGAIFTLAFLFAPRRGLVARWSMRRVRRQEFARAVLVVHLLHHEGTPAETEECRYAGLHEHFRWPQPRVRRVVDAATSEGWVQREGELLRLTATGREAAQAWLRPTAAGVGG